MRPTSLLLVTLAMAPRVGAEMVAVTPLDRQALPTQRLATLEKLLVGALARLDLHVVNVRGGRIVTPRSGETAPWGSTAADRARTIADDLHAPMGLAIDLASLDAGSEEQVVLYLAGYRAQAASTTGNTTLSLTLNHPDETALVGALVRTLLPERYRGRLELHVDVVGAETWIDGVVVHPPIELPCGTHALRVTHPHYRDFLKFVSVDYGTNTAIHVDLGRYPIDEGELKAREPIAPPPVVVPTLPWYRRGWVIGGASLVLLGTAAGITAAVVHSR